MTDREAAPAPTGSRPRRGLSRRAWLLAGAGAGGALLVGWSMMPPRSRLGRAHLMPIAAGEVALNGWLRIAADGAVVLAMPRSEMGQGVHTALPMLVAEELDLPLERVRIEQAGADAIYGNVAMFVASLPLHPRDTEPGQRTLAARAGEWMVAKLARELGINATGGSSSVADAWDVLRLAAAAARASLLGAAARQWQVPVGDLRIEAGAVTDAAGRRAHFGELVSAAAAIAPGDVRPKSPERWRLIGTDAPRLDLPGKVFGRAVFGIDVRLPDMLYATVRMCPMIGGAPGAIRPDTALRIPGVVRVVPLPGYAGGTAGFAVVGKTTWHAEQGARAVAVDWRQRPSGALDSTRIAAQLRRTVEASDGFVFHARGNTDQAERDAARVLQAIYEAPYLAHATLEPMNCTARVADGRVEIWVPTQVPQMARAQAARVAGVAVDAVTVHVTQLGGGFGRRLETDVVAQAVRVAMDCGGRPVLLTWPREEDMRHDFYRPMHVARLRAALDGQGRPLSLRIDSAGDAITPRWLGRNLPALAGPVDPPDKTTAEGLFDLPYGFPHQRMAHRATRSGVPVGYWRAVGHSHNAFFSECFVDELAHAAGEDPVAFRLRWLSDAPRHRAVLERVARESGWGQALPAGRARGVALHESFGSIVAQVAEVSSDAGLPRVHRVVCAIDCGTVVHPGIVRQQMEGSVVFALTAALHGRIDIDAGVVRQTNFPAYPLVSLKHAPWVDTHIIASDRPPTGVGEPGVPPLAPAVANAWFALTGERMRRLPLGA